MTLISQILNAMHFLNCAKDEMVAIKVVSNVACQAVAARDVYL